MENDNMATMEEIHDINLMILKEIDRICKKYDIQYFLFAGTLLGAIRHKNFIPWDDDADIVMTRKNYEKFLQHRDEISEKFLLCIPEEHTFFYDKITKLLYKNSQLRNERNEDLYYENYNNKISTDIFVLDIAFDDWRYFFQLNGIRVTYLMLMSKRYHIDFNDSQYSFLLKIAIRILSTIGKIVPTHFLLKIYSKLQTWAKNSKSDLLFLSTNQPEGLDHLFNKSAFKNELDGRLGDYIFPIPNGWDEVLKENYRGEYMTLPPEEKRKPIHIKLDEVKIEKGI